MSVYKQLLIVSYDAGFRERTIVELNDVYKILAEAYADINVWLTEAIDQLAKEVAMEDNPYSVSHASLSGQLSAFTFSRKLLREKFEPRRGENQ